MSYQQCSRFRTNVDFDREYLWNGSSNRQAEKNAALNYSFFHVGENNVVNFGPLTKKWPWPLTYDIEIVWFSCGCQDTCWCKISSSCVQTAAVHELSCKQRKNSDENHTDRRYRADSNKVMIRWWHQCTEYSSHVTWSVARSVCLHLFAHVSQLDASR